MKAGPKAIEMGGGFCLLVNIFGKYGVENVLKPEQSDIDPDQGTFDGNRAGCDIRRVCKTDRPTHCKDTGQ